MDLRGARLSRIRRQALEELERVGLATTLVAVVKRGVNDSEVADIVRHALTWNCVRGVTFQPVQDAGRNDHFDAGANRVVLSQIRREVAKSGVFGLEDMIPLPCNADQICIGYGLRQGKEVTPITSLLPRELMLQGPNTISYEAYPELRARDPRPALARHDPVQHRGKACRAAVLPAAGDGAGGPVATPTASGW